MGNVNSLTGTSETELARCLNLMENSLNHGEKAKLEVATYSLPTKEDLDTMWAEMTVSGFHVSKPTARIVQGIPLTSIVITKGSPIWAAIIPLIVPIAVIGLIAFGIAKIETITRALLPLVLAAGGLTIIALGIMRQPAIKAAETYARRR